MNNKALSEVVTNVLLILLVVIAIGVIWAFVGPMITSSGEKITGTQACMELVLEPLDCSYSVVIDDGETKNLIQAMVKRGSDKASLKEIKIVLENVDGSAEVISQTTNLPGELETSVFPIPTVITPVKIGVAGIVSVSGKDQICSETQRIKCALV